MKRSDYDKYIATSEETVSKMRTLALITVILQRLNDKGILLDSELESLVANAEDQLIEQAPDIEERAKSIFDMLNTKE